MPQDDDGAEKSWYEERDEEDEIPVKDRRVPANGPIKKLEELSYIRGFRDFPSVLTGGRLYDGTEQDDTRGKRGKDEMDELENPQLAGIMDNFKVSGGMKLELNDETREKDLKTILGPMYDPEDEGVVQVSSRCIHRNQWEPHINHKAVERHALQVQRERREVSQQVAGESA